jgi:glycosyltransferase involved in cell wall biosynthesis
MKLSVVIPCFNESKTIVEVLQKIRDCKLDDVDVEVIVVDDGSTDGTAALLSTHSSLLDVKVSMESNGGKGAAVIAGLRLARGDYVLIQDADLEYSPAEYERLLFPVLHFGAETVIGTRFFPPNFSRIFYLSHKIGNRLITILFNIRYHTTFSDIYCGYLVFRRDVINPDILCRNGWGQQAEILGILVKNSKEVYEVPIDYRGRSYGEGKKIRWYHIFDVIRAIFLIHK